MDNLGPIDELGSPTDAVPRAAPQRQDSVSSTAWLIRLPDDSYVLNLPTIGETTVDDDVTRTMTIPRQRRLDRQSSVANSDPPRRRGLAPERRGQQVNDGYVRDDDDDDEVMDDVSAIHQNTADMFNIALVQAQNIELENSQEQLPTDSWSASRWRPLASHA